ncbi:hypothetical protein JCM10295v2_002215 [Rhodotorula toruloides]
MHTAQLTSHARDAPHSASAGAPSPQWRTPHPAQTKHHRYRPTTSHAEDHVYVLTLRLSPSLHEPLNELRTRYFPADRLRVPAHLTLFHALPHSDLYNVNKTLEEVAGETEPFRITTGEAFKLGKAGVAVSPAQGTAEGAKVHAALRERWQGFLSKQDSKGFKAHWTVQNQEESEEKVDTAFAELRVWAKQTGAQGEADGLTLWRYDHGKWIYEREFPFMGAAEKTDVSAQH